MSVDRCARCADRQAKPVESLNRKSKLKQLRKGLVIRKENQRGKREKNRRQNIEQNIQKIVFIWKSSRQSSSNQLWHSLNSGRKGLEHLKSALSKTAKQTSKRPERHTGNFIKSSTDVCGSAPAMCPNDRNNLAITMAGRLCCSATHQSSGGALTANLNTNDLYGHRPGGVSVQGASSDGLRWGPFDCAANASLCVSMRISERRNFGSDRSSKLQDSRGLVRSPSGN